MTDIIKIESDIKLIDNNNEEIVVNSLESEQVELWV